jgi:formate-dependent nitrite reductase cytochrome c552 subunit
MSPWNTAVVLSLCLGVGTASWAADAAKKAEPAKTESTWDNVKDYSHKEKNKAVAAGKQLIADTDKKIDELSKQAKNSSAETKAAHEANMKELQQKKKAAQVELDKLGKATGDVWDATKTGFSDAGKALGAAYDKAAAAVKK